MRTAGMGDTCFLSDPLESVSDRGRALLGRDGQGRPGTAGRAVGERVRPKRGLMVNYRYDRKQVARQG